MRKLIPGNYNIICKGKSGQLIETSPGLGPTTPRDKIFSIVANSPGGVVSDGSYIYFSTYASGVRREEWQRIYKYSIVDAVRIWTTKLIYVYHGTDDTFSSSTYGHLFVLGNYIYLQKRGGVFQRYLKSDGSKYGGELSGPGWGSNCFVDGNYAYSWSVGWTSSINKYDSNLNHISTVEFSPPSYPDYERESNFYHLFVLGWDGSHLCGGYNQCYRMPDPPPYGSFGEVAWAKWSKSGGDPTSKWICPPPANPEDVPLYSNCGGNNIIIGDEIWSFGEYHDGERVPYNPWWIENPEKNAMYYNANWRLTAGGLPYISPYDPGEWDFYNYGSFYRGRYGEGFSYNHIERQIAKHGDKLYVTLDPHGPGSREDMIGTHEMTTDGVYRNVHIV